MFGIPMELLVPLFGALFGAFQSFKFVQEGEQGCILRFGKVVKKNGEPRIVQPGFVLLIPFIETLQRRHVRQQTILFERQEILIKGNLVFEIGAVIRFQIRDVYKALFVIDDLEESLENFVSGILRDIVQGKEAESLSDTASINNELVIKLKEVQEEWGVEFKDSKLNSCAPTTQSARLLTIKEEGLRRAKLAKELKAEYSDLQSILPALIGTPFTVNLDQG